MNQTRLYLSINETADRLNIARITAYRWTEMGYLPSIKLGSRRMVPIAALEAFLAKAAEKAAQ
jgi:excisionase family DNA binding protein